MHLSPLLPSSSSSSILMAADVTSIVRIMEAYKEEAEGKRRGLFTRNLLGEYGDGAADSAISSSSKELDLDLQVPSGWERRLDLMSGKTYLHRMDFDLSRRGLHDLNLPPPATSSNIVSAALPDDSSILDLKLAGGCGGGGLGGEYLSVCTLEKVKSALERAGRGSSDKQLSRDAAAASSSSPASPSSSTTSSSMKRRGTVAEDDDGRSDSTGGMMAAACPSCLLYVLISKANPRCPGCDSHVPVPFLQKKLKFDLNFS